MTLIKSISGIRGTIGNKPGDGLTPIDVVKFASAYAEWLKNASNKNKLQVVVGRDARISGEMVNSLVVSSLIGSGINVIDVGLATTPTVEMAVIDTNSDGGVILTASHNPRQWNALKLLNKNGEFLNVEDGNTILIIAENEDFNYAEVDNIGKIIFDDTFTEKHIKNILNLPLVDVKAIKKERFKVVIDAVNSVGGIAIPALLKSLGVTDIIELNCTPDGEFAHNPEPLPEHLKDISKTVIKNKADVGFVVDPDVDRLAIVNEDGSMFGEEYTIVAVADYILSNKKGNTVSNLSSSRALRDITEKHGGLFSSAAVGEVNVVKKMKETNAVIGGEGNGGVIYPELHYGRDALVGIALFLTNLAKTGKKVSEIRNSFPKYVISKNKIQLTPDINVDKVLERIKEKYKNQPINDIDGLKIEFDKNWVHLRKSNTEAIIRIYSESNSEKNANDLAQRIINDIKSVI